MRARLILAAAAAAVLSSAGGVEGTAASRGPERSPTPVAARLAEAASPGFLENGGRFPAAVDFTVDAPDRTFFFGRDGVTISLHDAARSESGRWVLKLAFDGARSVRPAAGGERPGVTNFLKGPKEAWHVGLHSFGRIVYRDLWPGIDLTWTAETGRLKWRCDVRAGADPAAVGLVLEGAERLALDAAGALDASTPFGDFVDAAPVAWQTVGGREVKVESAFRLDAATGRVRVAVAAYDAASDLVIDPSTVVRAGFIGGLFDDVGTSVAVDSARNVFVAGITKSTEATFPVFSGADVTYNGGTGDAFVFKIDANFQPVWSTYLGGSGADGAAAVAVDTFGTCFVAGSTLSTDFPIVGSLGAVRGGGFDAFVAKIAPSGRSLLWSAVFGGPGEDRALALAVDRFGRAIVAGKTAGGMPWGTGYGGGLSDAFAFGIHADGTFLDWGTYLGGGLGDSATGVAVDAAFGVYLCGNTVSPHTTFPVSVGPDLVENGLQDAWVAKLDGTNHLVTYAGYVGGSGVDTATGIAVDTLGRAYVVGSTFSTEATFPVAVGPHLVHHGKSEAYVARVAADGSALDWCGFVGGSGDDFGYAIALDASRRAYVVGTTGSTEKGFPMPRANFPVVDGPDLTFNGGIHDGWIGVVQPDGSQMDSLGYIGGTGNIDDATAVAIHLNGDVVVVGDSASAAKSFPAGTGPAIVSAGAREAFIAQLQFTAPSPLVLVPHLDAVAASGFDVNVDWTDADTNDTGFDVQRTAADGTATLFSIASPAAPTGPVRFTDTTASPGTRYAYRVRAVGANGAGEFSEILAVTTPPSINLKMKTGSLTGAGTDLTGVAALRLKFGFQHGSPTSSLNPVADGISITIVGAGADQTVAVPPNDPGWTVAGSFSTWTSPVPGVARIVVDTVKRTIALDATGFTWTAPLPHNAVRILVRSGGSFGARGADWRRIGTTQYRFP